MEILLIFINSRVKEVRTCAHYAGVFVWDPTDGQVLAVSDSSHQNADKMAGGMSTGDELPEETARRKAIEELKTQVLKSTLAYVQEIPGKTGMHIRYFFLVDQYTGALEKGTTWQIEEKDADGKVVEKLVAKWVPIRQFADKLFYRQHPAFGAILGKLASRDMKFLNDYRDLIERFPEPENLGLKSYG